MLSIALVLLVQASAPNTSPFQISSNKPFVQVAVNGSTPQWFILDSGNNAPSILGRECADRLALTRGAEEKTQIGAGSGSEIGLSSTKEPVFLEALGETITVAQPYVFPMGHIARLEGRRVDGLLGNDFFSRHVVVLDYARSTITTHDPASYAPPKGATIVPLELDTGWPVVEGTITTRDGKTVPCDLIIDTGVRFTIALFRPFSAKHGLHDGAAGMRSVVIGGGAGGVSRGDIGRLQALSLGPASFQDPVAVFSRDSSGIFSLDPTASWEESCCDAIA